MAIAALKSAARSVAQSTGIAQDNIIFAMVVFAFVVWITTKGELKTYLQFFTPGSNPASNALGIDETVTASSTGVAPAASAANPNPGLLGSNNPLGAATANPSTAFGFLPALSGAWANVKSLVTGGGKVAP